MSSKIIGYRGIANEKKVIIAGHVFESHKVKVPDPDHHYLYNLRQTIRRFRASPLKKAVVEVVIEDEHKFVKTSSSGYFVCEFEHNNPTPGWYEYGLFLSDLKKGFHGEYKVSNDEDIGVISDIDDTVLVSHSTRLLWKMKHTLFRNAYTRRPIPFIKGWFRHLQEFSAHIDPQDYYYVSNSEWNLYDLLTDFFDVNKLPKGVFMLQNLKRGLRDIVKTGRINSTHKEESINFLLRFYPRKQFVLVGDNGQKDVEIYRKVCREHGQRIKGVMIRKLAYVKDEHRMDRFTSDLQSMGVPVLYFR